MPMNMISDGSLCLRTEVHLTEGQELKTANFIQAFDIEMYSYGLNLQFLYSKTKKTICDTH